jgi:hypothetical protein
MWIWQYFIAFCTTSPCSYTSAWYLENKEWDVHNGTLCRSDLFIITIVSNGDVYLIKGGGWGWIMHCNSFNKVTIYLQYIVANQPSVEDWAEFCTHKHSPFQLPGTRPYCSFTGVRYKLYPGRRTEGEGASMVGGLPPIALLLCLTSGSNYQKLRV